MPIYEYYCEPCEAIFEELHLSMSLARNHSESFPCKYCGGNSERIPSASNFSLKGVSEGDPSRRGNSGFHDLDYPSLDKAVGRSSNRKWREFNMRKAERDQIRKESGSVALSVNSDGSVVPTPKNTLEVRQKALSTFSNVKKKSES